MLILKDRDVLTPTYYTEKSSLSQIYCPEL